MRSRFVAAATIAVGCTPISDGSPSPYADGPVPEPTLFAPGAISTDAQEFGITFTPDGTTAFYTRRLPGERQKIFTSRFVAGAWTPGEQAWFSNDVDETPFITPAGDRLFFSTRRPGAGFPDDPSDNVWVMDRTDSGWSDPRPLPGDVNRPRPPGAGWPAGSEVGAVLHESELYYYSSAEDRDANLYTATERDGRFVDPAPLAPPVNSAGTEANPALTPDGAYLIFQGYGREVEIGAEDLFISERTTEGWSDPVNMGPLINTTANEGFPAFSPDGRYFFFASDRHGDEGRWSIYVIETAALGLGADR